MRGKDLFKRGASPLLDTPFIIPSSKEKEGVIKLPRPFGLALLNDDQGLVVRNYFWLVRGIDGQQAGV